MKQCKNVFFFVKNTVQNEKEMFLFKIAAAACDMLPGGKLSAFIGDIGTAMSILLGLLGSVSIMLFISFMSVIKAVTG